MADDVKLDLPALRRLWIAAEKPLGLTPSDFMEDSCPREFGEFVAALCNNFGRLDAALTQAAEALRRYRHKCEVEDAESGEDTACFDDCPVERRIGLISEYPVFRHTERCQQARAALRALGMEP